MLRNGKQLDLNDEMIEQINFIADSDVDTNAIAVFEASVASTRPLNKLGSVFHEGKMTQSLLNDMAAALNSKEQSVPLHVMHDSYSELPVGRVFNAYVDGEDLKAQFYLPKTEASTIEKIDLGVLDETSVGVRSQRILCSECGWDYRGDDASIMNFFDQTCENGHTIGENGTHAILSGLDQWMELSLVSRGASSKAKIHGRAKNLTSPEQQERIAASGHSVEAVSLFASLSTKEHETMAEVTGANPDPAPPASAEFDAKAAHDELTAKLTELTEALGNIDLSTVMTEVAGLKAQIEELGKPKANDLAGDLPKGGVAADADAGTGDNATQNVNLSAFQGRHKGDR